jgi:hypothetical protein
MKYLIFLVTLVTILIGCDRANITIKGEEVIYIKCTLGICDVVTEKGSRYIIDTLNLETLYDHK